VTCADAVILSSHADELSYESEKLGNGLFTYALLNCLAGAADTDGDHVITAGELGPMLEKKLGDLTKQLRFPSQKPLVVALRDSFVISVVKDQLKK